jgi:DNA-directed RNA polymerase subunit B"
MLDRAALAKSYFTHERLVKHQLDSFNYFIEKGLQSVIDEQEKIETDIPDTYVKLGKISVGTPIVKEADGSEITLFPHVARIRNLTYAAPLYLTGTVVDQGEEKEEETVRIGMLPIMVRSSRCNLNTVDDVSKYGEDPLDPGGYFIVNGSERVLMSLEDLAPNKIFLEFEERYGDRIEVAKVFSQKFGYRALVIVERGKDSLLEVSFPYIPKRLSFVTLMRALGVESDQEIVGMVSNDPEILKYMLENLEMAEVETQEEAIELIGKKVAPGQAREYRITRANYVIDNYLLPHLGTEEEDRRAKAFFLGRMAEAVFELALGRRGEDDKDHYANKRLKLAGDLMEDLFRVSFIRLAKDIKYQLERAKVRNRDLTLATAVRADVLTERIMHPMATGNWVGGRTGVSQLLDRTNYVSVLSHLRRVISPLSRSQPHFEARDLHPTQWGRICPSETPEGPNCGLVKNFAQMAEVSTGVDEDIVRHILFDLGVEPIRREF